MIGVILWSDTTERKAVVWCEDHGDLAFLNCEETRLEQLGYLTTGDILEFDVEIDGNFRRVNNPTLVKGYDGENLASNLKNSSQTVDNKTGKIVLFRRQTPATQIDEVRSDIAI